MHYHIYEYGRVRASNGAGGAIGPSQQSGYDCSIECVKSASSSNPSLQQRIPSRWIVALLPACALSSSPPFHPPAHSITCSLGWPCSVTAADCSDGPNVLGGRRVLVERHDVSMESCQPQRQRVSAFVMIHCIQPQRLNAWPTTTHCSHCQPAHHTPYHTREGQRQCIER